VRRLTIRARLTVIYGGLFLAAGFVLLAVTYLLVQHSLNGGNEASFSQSEGTGPAIATNFRRQVRDDTLDSLLTQGGIALGGVGLVASGFGWLAADRVLRPLHRITETARRVADRNLHERIALTGPRDEIKDLADTFDSMLERLDRSFDGQRRFVANASHELRTPLAVNRTLLEVALRRPDTTQRLHDLAETLLSVNAAHEQLIDGLLTLARSEQGITVHEPVDLADLARRAADQHGLPTTALDPAPTTGDPVLLERIVQNLVQNGVAYNTDAHWVCVTTTADDHTAELTVSNTGPLVPAYEIPALFEPFRRLHDRVTPGTGLGLSIVRSVTHAHGGTVTAVPRPGGGLKFTVTLPKRS
jgi:signal transduction histidine kinase